MKKPHSLVCRLSNRTGEVNFTVRIRPLLVLMGASSMKIIWVKIMIPNHCLRTISFTFKSLIKMRILTINLRSRLRNRFKI